jgi:hypothetical protein
METSTVTTAIRASALEDRALNYAVVEPSIDIVAQAIRDQHGACIGLTGSNNGTWRTVYPSVKMIGPQWRHEMYFGRANVVNGRKKVWALNSWGTGVGLAGWQALGEEYFDAGLVWDVKTLIFNPTPVKEYSHYFGRDINYGEISEEVRALQSALQASGEFPQGMIPVPVFGENTRKALLKFQYRYHVASDFVIWFNNGKHCSSGSRRQLNLLFGN